MKILDNLTSPDFIGKIKSLAAMHPEPLEGIDAEEITKAEQRLGFALPQPLKDLYLTIGKSESAMTAFHPFNTPEELTTYVGVDEDEHPDLTVEQLEALGGDLVFAFENQGCWAARYNRETKEVYLDLMTESDPYNKARREAEQTAQKDSVPQSSEQANNTQDAEQTTSKTNDIQPFYVMGTNLEGVIIWLLAQQCLNTDMTAGEFRVEAKDADAFIQKLQQYFLPYSSGLASCLADVYFNPEQKIVVMLVKDPDGSYHGEVVANDDEYFDALWEKAEKVKVEGSDRDNDGDLLNDGGNGDDGSDDCDDDDEIEDMTALDDFAETMQIEISYW